MALPNHYRTLEVSPTATQTEIKQAYRRLAKLFHPDSNRTAANHDRIAGVNAAYEILGDPQSRRAYDQQLRTRSRLETAGFAVDEPATRAERTAAAQSHYRRQRRAAQQADADTEQWLKKVYTPVCRLLHEVIKPLKEQLEALSADPFDDDLMQDFQDYLEDCQDLLDRADTTFRSLPNPASVAGVAAHLYYCLNQVRDGLEQLEMFTLNYDDHYLHTGQELFRIAAGLRREAQAAAKAIA
jgi:molecular chaperone DnaJ